jgi:hypothetical protein
VVSPASSTPSSPTTSSPKGPSRQTDQTDNPNLPGYTPGKRVVLLIGAVLIVTLGVNIWASLRNRAEANREAKAEKIVDDPSRVRHVWEISDSGLVETATALDNDPETEALIRQHFTVLYERRKFFGNFGTAQFKNKPLPGRDGLEKLVPKMTITQADIAGGATLTFATKDAKALAELRQWATALTEERAKRTPATP